MGEACMGEKRNAHRILVWKSEGMKPLEGVGTDRNIVLKHQEHRMEGIDWIHLAQPTKAI
jgi:hypothetical protein